MIVLAVEAATYHAPWLRTRPDDYGAQVRNRLQNGLAYSAVEYLEALRWRGHGARGASRGDRQSATRSWRRRRARSRRRIAETDVGGAGNAEAIIQGITRFMRPINYLGLPALVVPAGIRPARHADRAAADRAAVRRRDRRPRSASRSRPRPTITRKVPKLP